MARVLVVDDAKFMRLTLKGMLEEGGHTVVAEAGDGNEAIKEYSNSRPDIVTMDITMPSMSGIDALKGILAIDPNAKVLMCSAMGQQTMVVDAIKSGAKDFIVKPFNKERVLDAVNKHTK